MVAKMEVRDDGDTGVVSRSGGLKWPTRAVQKRLSVGVTGNESRTETAVNQSQHHRTISQDSPWRSRTLRKLRTALHLLPVSRAYLEDHRRMKARARFVRAARLSAPVTRLKAIAETKRSVTALGNSSVSVEHQEEDEGTEERRISVSKAWRVASVEEDKETGRSVSKMWRVASVEEDKETGRSMSKAWRVSSIEETTVPAVSVCSDLLRSTHIGLPDDGRLRVDEGGDGNLPVEEGGDRKIRGEEPMARFRRAARLVQLILTAITSTRRENQRREAKLMSFYQLQDEIGTTKGRYGDGLDFDPTYFRACRQIQISDLAKHILMMDPKDRTDEQRHVALVSLTQAVDAFGEFPIKMQKSLVKRGWYEHFEAKRVIIRQGHAAENFYFILSGTAVVTILSTNKKTGESVNNTVAFLKKGNSFGELALMYGGTRNATVTCKDNVELLAVARDDFVDIFMHVDKDVEPDHIQFLRLIEFFDGWPIERLPYADPKTCLFTYFRRGVIMCRDSISSEWIYVVKTGSCRVLKALQPVKADMQTIPSDLRGSTNSLQGTPNSPRRAPPLSNRNESNKSSSNQRYLPPLKGINHDAAKESRIQHKANIDKIYEDRHQSTQKRVQFEKAKAKPVPNAKVYVEIQKLGPKETFGFVSVAFQLMEEPLSLILVSDGAECVLINKRFFLQHLSESHHKYLRKSIQPFPTEEHLQQKLQDQVNWDAYKAVTFHKEVIHNKKLHDTLLL